MLNKNYDDENLMKDKCTSGATKKIILDNGWLKEVKDNIPQVGEHTKNAGYPLF